MLPYGIYGDENKSKYIHTGVLVTFMIQLVTLSLKLNCS